MEAIDQAKRVVTIKTDAGELETVDVPEGAKRFNELKVGDKVKATYNNTVIAILKQPGEPPVDTSRTLRTGGEGERPGGSMAMERRMTVNVDAIDKSKSSITFVGPNGWKYSRVVTDPNVLDMLKVGDKMTSSGTRTSRSQRSNCDKSPLKPGTLGGLDGAGGGNIR